MSYVFEIIESRAMAHAVVADETRVLSKSNRSPCVISGGQNGLAAGLSVSSSVFSCHCHCTNSPYSFIPLSPTLCSLSEW